MRVIIGRASNEACNLLSGARTWSARPEGWLTESSSAILPSMEASSASSPPRRDGGRRGPAGRGLRVWLDDDLEDRPAPSGWVHASTAWEATELLDGGSGVELSLDHDLGDDELNGRAIDVVDYIAEQQVVWRRVLWPRDGITLHTANPSGRDAMRLTILRYASEVLAVSESLSPGAHRVFHFARRSR